MTIKSLVIRYQGGKFRLAPWVLQHFPPHTYMAALHQTGLQLGGTA